jgi:hypothetical protein
MRNDVYDFNTELAAAAAKKPSSEIYQKTQLTLWQTHKKKIGEY